MSQERLEKIRDIQYKINLDDIEWLIKRVELLGKLREEDSTYYNELLTRVREQNQRYREAIKTALKVSEYYNAFGGDLEKVIADIHNILDKALESDNE